MCGKIKVIVNDLQKTQGEKIEICDSVFSMLELKFTGAWTGGIKSLAVSKGTIVEFHAPDTGRLRTLESTMAEPGSTESTWTQPGTIQSQETRSLIQGVEAAYTTGVEGTTTSVMRCHLL